MKKILLVLTSLLLFQTLSQAQTVSLVKDLNTGTADGFDEWNNKSITYNDIQIFPATDGTNGLELYALKAGQLTLIKDINSGSESSNPANFILFNDKVYFTAYDPAHGEEIWSTDGTEAGTTLAIETIDGTDPSSGYGTGTLIPALNGNLYFSLDGAVYVSDGTTSNTSAVSGITGNVDFNEESSIASPVVTKYGNGIAFFSKSDADVNIYKLDVSAAQLLKTITFDKYSTTDVYGLSEVSAGLLFAVNNSFHTEYNGLFVIKRSDGFLTEIKDGSNASIDVNRVLHFTSSKALFKMTSGGIYATDGTQAGTVKITPATYTLYQGERIPHAIINDKIVFYGDYVLLSSKIYISDGTVAGTSIIASDQSYLSNFISSGNTVAWASGLVNNFSPRIWTADVSTKTSKKVYEFTESSSTPDAAIMLGFQDSKIYFEYTLGGKGRELYSLSGISLGIFSGNAAVSEAYKLCTINAVNGTYAISTPESSETLEIIQYDLTGRILKMAAVTDNEYFTIDTKTPVSIIKITGNTGTVSYKVTAY